MSTNMHTDRVAYLADLAKLQDDLARRSLINCYLIAAVSLLGVAAQVFNLLHLAAPFWATAGAFGIAVVAWCWSLAKGVKLLRQIERQRAER